MIKVRARAATAALLIGLLWAGTARAQASGRVGEPPAVFALSGAIWQPIEPLAEFSVPTVLESVLVFEDAPDPETCTESRCYRRYVGIIYEVGHDAAHMPDFTRAYRIFTNAFLGRRQVEVEIGNDIGGKDFGPMPYPDFVSGRLPAIFEGRFSLKPEVVRPVLDVSRPTNGNRNIRPQLALASFSSLAPLTNGSDGNHGSNGRDMLFKNAADTNQQIPDRGHDTPISALIFIFGTILVLIWGRR